MIVQNDYINYNTVTTDSKKVWPIARYEVRDFHVSLNFAKEMKYGW
jgi:phage anti-repressor protein